MLVNLTVCVSKNVVSRAKLDKTIVANFERVTGIKKTRHWEGNATTLAMRTAQFHGDKFPMKSGGDPIGAVICITQSPDRKSPCMAIEIHRALGLESSIPAFDVNQSCDGFIYGWWLASQLGKPVLVVCVDMLRAPTGADTLIFSDAACAFIVDGAKRIDPAVFLTDGTGAKHLCSNKQGLLAMDGGMVFDFATRNVPALIKDYQIRFGHYQFLAQHQPNLSMMKLIEGRTGFTGRSLHCIEEYGNCSMVSIAATLAYNEKQILDKKVLLCGYGAGWAAAIMGCRWAPFPVTQLLEI